MTEPLPESRVCFGPGVISHLPGILAERKRRRVLLVSGKSAYANSGLASILAPLSGSMSIHHFSEFSSNPQIEQIQQAAALVREWQCDAVVGLGGGTAMDIAKAAAVLAFQERSAVECVLYPGTLRPRDCLLIAAPTTAGTGSEATSFCVVYVDGRKRSLDHPSLMPDYAVVDPTLTTGLPPRVAASAALDALCQSMESLWSIRSTEWSLQRATEALRLVLKHSAVFCRQPSLESREGMARAALLAGQAINVTRTTAPHAVSYGLTSLFGVPHGHSCALTLPHFLVYNARVTQTDVTDPRGIEWVQERIRAILDLLQAQSAEEGCIQIQQLVARSGLEFRLSGLGLGPAEIEQLMNYGFDLDRAGNNPRRLTPEGLREVLTRAL